MGDWKRIETAPKDGTRILVWERGRIFEVSWGDAFLADSNGPIFGWMTEGTSEKHPSHWMPLPEPPHD